MTKVISTIEDGYFADAKVDVRGALLVEEPPIRMTSTFVLYN